MYIKCFFKTCIQDVHLQQEKRNEFFVIIQLSNGGAQFYAGKSLNNDNLQ